MMQLILAICKCTRICFDTGRRYDECTMLKFNSLGKNEAKKNIVYILDRDSFFYEMMQTLYHDLYFIGIGINV